MKVPRVCIAVALASISSVVAPPLLGQASFIDIGSLSPFGSSFLWSVNNRNEAVGWSELGGLDSEHAIVWRDGVLVDLGGPPGYDISRAFGINDRGQIVGISVQFEPLDVSAVLWQDGQAVVLGGGVNCNATSINNRGDIAGACGGAVVWRGDELIALTPPPGYSGGYAAAINEAGAVVGAVTDGAGQGRAFRWSHSTMTILPVPPGATQSSATAINDRGDVIGNIGRSTVDTSEPVVWGRDTVTPLAGSWGAFHGIAWGVNNRGEVVGAGHDASHAPGAPGGVFVWSGGHFRFLPGDGLAQDINERGVVVGRFSSFEGGGFTMHGIVWPKAGIRLLPEF